MVRTQIAVFSPNARWRNGDIRESKDEWELRTALRKQVVVLKKASVTWRELHLLTHRIYLGPSIEYWRSSEAVAKIGGDLQSHINVYKWFDPDQILQPHELFRDMNGKGNWKTVAKPDALRKTSFSTLVKQLNYYRATNFHMHMSLLHRNISECKWGMNKFGTLASLT